MTRKSSPKSATRSVKSTTKPGAKKQKKMKAGLYFTIVGNPKFWLLDVNKAGKLDKTEISHQTVVDCVMYCLEEGVREMVNKAGTKETTNEKVDNSAPADDGDCTSCTRDRDGRPLPTPAESWLDRRDTTEKFAGSPTKNR